MKVDVCNDILFYQPCKMMHCTHQLAYIAHFVIIPANGFHHLFVTHGHNFGLGCIKQRSETDADHICTHNLIFIISEAFVCSSNRPRRAVDHLANDQIERYSRQLLLEDGFGVEGQCKLLSSSVLVVGAGGIGSTGK